MKLDYNLYVQLLNHRSHSGTKAQDKYARWLRNWIKANVPGAVITTDKAGNTYVTKGQAPYVGIVSHIDINQAKIARAQVVRTGDWITGIDLDTGLQCGVGHDDKAGNLLALQLLTTQPSLKCLFTTDEEVGGQGAYEADVDFLNDCSFVVQADRNAYNGPELITYSGGMNMASSYFVETIAPTMEQYDFRVSSGVFTDVNVLKSEGLTVSAVNITAGYYDEHSEAERLYIPSWENSAAFTLTLIIDYGHMAFPHTAQPRSYKAYTSYKATAYSWELPKLTGKQYACPNCGSDIDASEIYDGYCYCWSCADWDVPKEVVHVRR